MFGVRQMAMVNLLGLMERAGVSPEVARPAAWTVFFLSAGLLLALWKRNPLNPPFALAMWLAVFTAPHLYGHDLALLLVTFATLSNPNPLILLISSLALIATNVALNNWQFAIVYLFMGVLLALSIMDLRRARAAT